MTSPIIRIYIHQIQVGSNHYNHLLIIGSLSRTIAPEHKRTLFVNYQDHCAHKRRISIKYSMHMCASDAPAYCHIVYSIGPLVAYIITICNDHFAHNRVKNRKKKTFLFLWPFIGDRIRFRSNYARIDNWNDDWLYYIELIPRAHENYLFAHQFVYHELLAIVLCLMRVSGTVREPRVRDQNMTNEHTHFFIYFLWWTFCGHRDWLMER